MSAKAPARLQLPEKFPAAENVPSLMPMAKAQTNWYYDLKRALIEAIEGLRKQTDALNAGSAATDGPIILDDDGKRKWQVRVNGGIIYLKGPLMMAICCCWLVAGQAQGQMTNGWLQGIWGRLSTLESSGGGPGGGVAVKAGANVTTATNAGAVTVSADVSHGEVSNATNGLNSSLTTRITNATNDVYGTLNAAKQNVVADPGYDGPMGWDDTDNGLSFWHLGSGLSYSHATHTVSATSGGGGPWSVTPATGSEDAAGFNLNNVGTLRVTNQLFLQTPGGGTITLGTNFPGPSAGGGIGIYGTNSRLGGINGNLRDNADTGITVSGTNSATANFSQFIATFGGKGSAFETLPVLVTNTYGSGANLLEVKGSAVNFIVANDGSASGKARLTPRLTTITSSATPAVNSDVSDCVNITALAVAITSMSSSLTGTPNDFDRLEYRIKDNGSARAITWGASFVAGPAALPTTTTSGKALHVYFEWDAAQSKWVCASTGSDA